jgi:hypothetical protein
MDHAALWVNVAQLIVATVALAVSIVALRRKQAPSINPPPQTLHRPPSGGL